MLSDDDAEEGLYILLLTFINTNFYTWILQ